MSIKVIIAGFKGRMGQAAYKMVSEDPELELAGLIDPFTDETEVAGVPVFNRKEDLVGLEADVWVDFTMPKVAYENTRFAVENGFAPVVGTTGFIPEQIQELTELSRDKGLGGLIAPNFAIGAVLLMQFAAQAAKYFPNVEIIELHHDKKKDAPSGTALLLANSINEVCQEKKEYIYDRTPKDEARKTSELGISVVRGGTIPGEHIVIYAGEDEILEFKHTALSRNIFAKGALEAAEFLAKQPSGKYNMADLVNQN